MNSRPQCRPKFTTAEFVEAANQVHNGRYAYENTVYLGTLKPISITCPEHGQVQVRSARAHLSKGAGCPHCGRKLAGEKCLKMSTEKFVTLAKQRHTTTYDYSRVEYTGVSKKVIIGCPVHGWFKQGAQRHLDGHQCSKCFKSFDFLTFSPKRSAEPSRLIKQGRSSMQWYGNIHCRSSYEVRFLKLCKKHNIKVRSAESKKFRVRYFNPQVGKWRWYYPDFYLPDYDRLVEVKPKIMCSNPVNRAKVIATRRIRTLSIVTELDLEKPTRFLNRLERLT